MEKPKNSVTGEVIINDTPSLEILVDQYNAIKKIITYIMSQ